MAETPDRLAEVEGQRVRPLRKPKPKTTPLGRVGLTIAGVVIAAAVAAKPAHADTVKLEVPDAKVVDKKDGLATIQYGKGYFVTVSESVVKEVVPGPVSWAPPAGAEEAIDSIVGKWDSKFGEITFTKKDGKIIGTYNGGRGHLEQKGDVTLDGERRMVLKYSYYETLKKGLPVENAYTKGEGYFIISKDGLSMEGIFHREGFFSRKGVWSARKKITEAEAAPPITIQTGTPYKPQVSTKLPSIRKIWPKSKAEKDEIEELRKSLAKEQLNVELLKAKQKQEDLRKRDSTQKGRRIYQRRRR